MTSETPVLTQRIDLKSRIYIPKELREAAGLHCGDIVRISPGKDGLTIHRMHVVETGDKSPEVIDAYVRAAIRQMPRDWQLSIAAELLRQLDRNGKEPV